MYNVFYLRMGSTSIGRARHAKTRNNNDHLFINIAYLNLMDAGLFIYFPRDPGHNMYFKVFEGQDIYFKKTASPPYPIQLYVP